MVVASVQARAAALSSQVQFTKVTLTPAASLSIENPPPVLCCYCCILLTTVPRVLGCLDFKIEEFLDVKTEHADKCEATLEE